MRDRARPEQEQQRNERDRDHAPERQTARVRVPKIQYRFIKELEQTGVGGESRINALAMADKIKRYPLEAQHVMASWERFTKKSIDEFKARGKNEANDRQHVAYAIVFSAMRDGQPAQSIGDLKQRIEVFSANHPPQSANRAAPAQAPQQQNLLEQQHHAVERQVETALVLLRGLTPQLRETIEGAARQTLVEGHHSASSAREALPAAARALQNERTEANTINALSLAVVARTPDHATLIREINTLSDAELKSVLNESRARTEQSSIKLDEARRDALAAAVRAAVAPETRRDALVAAAVREHLECVANPRRGRWDDVAEQLAQDLA
jgi:hypothetical protein